MTGFEIDTDGFEKTRKAFEDLRDRYGGDGVTYIVGTTVEYGVFGVRN